jgi:hypothetical protein
VHQGNLGLKERVQPAIDIGLLAAPRRGSCYHRCRRRRVAHDVSPTLGQRGTTRLSRQRAALLARRTSIWRTSTSIRRARMSYRKARTVEMLPITKTTATDASVGPTARPGLVATVEAPKAPSSSPTLESETMLETFLPMQRRRPTVVAAASTHLRPAFFIS